MKNIDCPLEYLSGILAKDYKVKISTTQYAKSKSKYSSINDEAWHGYIKKRLNAVYVQNNIHVKLECSYTAEISKSKNNIGYNVYYHKRGYYELDQIDVSILGYYLAQANHKAGRYIPIYDRTIKASEYAADANGLTEPLIDFANAAELALAGQYMPKPVEFSKIIDQNSIMFCQCVDIVTIRENGRITNDVHNPNLKPYFLLYLNIPNGLPLIDIGKGHLAIVTDGQLYYTASRYLDKHVYLVQKDIKELSSVGGNINTIAADAISIYLNNINEGISDSRKLPTRL